MLLLYIIIVVFILAIIVELSLRYFMGFGKTITYVESPDYEYIPSPNKNIKRLGNRLIYNEYSMRSLPLRANDSVFVLWMGDSIINGGNGTDHDALATTEVEKYFQQKMGKSTRVLNVSAGSWEPDNAIAYLKKHGHFGAKVLLLTFSSHDAYHYMTFEKTVGVFPDYPDKQPFCAISEIFFRYLLPKITGDPYKKAYHKRKNDPTIPDEAKIKPRTTLNTGFQDLLDYARSNKLEIHFILHPELKELKMQKYDERGQEIISWLNKNKISYTLEMEGAISETMYRDSIHFNEKGQKYMANLAISILEKLD